MVEPELGDNVVITGGKVKVWPLLETPFAVTTIGPVDAVLGTGTVTLVSLQAVGVPSIPLNFTVLLPCDVPKLLPLIVIEVLTVAKGGDRLLMFGVGNTVK